MSSRLWTLPLLVAFLIAAGAGTGFAIPSLGGPTGIVAVPNALVASQDQLQTALSYQSMEAAALGMYGTEDFTLWGLQALLGVADQAELWGAYSTVSNDDDSHIWGFGGKVQLAKEPQDQASLAVGGAYQAWSDAGDLNLWNAYIVVTKDLTPLGGESWEWSAGAGPQMLGSVGLVYINLDPDVGEDDSLTRPFLGLEFIGAEGAALGLEYRWKDSDLDDKAVFSAVLRQPVSKDWTVEVGTTNAAPGGIGLDDQDWFVRVGYNIPLGGAM